MTIVALSARAALLHCAAELPARGSCIELYLPSLGGSEIEVLAGIDQIEPVREGVAVLVEFIVVEERVRRALNDLMSLLLAGDGGGRRAHPRVIYDVMVRYGDQHRIARLEELSMGGALMRTYEALEVNAPVSLSIPHPTTRISIAVSGRVANIRRYDSRSFSVGVAFEIDATTRASVAAMLAELMAR